MPRGPMCFRCRIVRPSGPAARELPLFLMARAMCWGWKNVVAVSRGRVLMMCLLTRRVSGSEEWGTMEVNSLQKALAMSLFLQRVRELKVIG